MMPRDDDDKREKRRGVRCVFCLRVFFCRVYVQLRRRELGWLMQMYRVQCVSIAPPSPPPHIYICYPVQYFLPRLFISVPRIHGECVREALFLKKGKGKEEDRRREGETSGERQPLAQASFIDRYTLPCRPARVTRRNKRSYIL